jgi:hypothetical protein
VGATAKDPTYKDFLILKDVKEVPQEEALAFGGRNQSSEPRKIVFRRRPVLLTISEPQGRPAQIPFIGLHFLGAKP